jgi:hypothetical protein
MSHKSWGTQKAQKNTESTKKKKPKRGTKGTRRSKELGWSFDLFVLLLARFVAFCKDFSLRT